MKSKGLLIIAAILGLTLFVAAGIYAGTEVKDEIQMENKAYDKHKKGIVKFTHKQHTEEYAKKAPELYKNGCGECHHNDKNEALKDLKVGDDVQNCIACHKKPGEKPKKEKLSKKEEMEYHAEAIHENCKGCHKAYNDAKGTKDAPTSCTKCHPKEKK